MNRFFLLAFLIFSSGFTTLKSNDFIERQGEVTFFSYTSVENIQATNNQVVSVFNTDTNEIAVRILMHAFKFKKSLMHEHFNESYIESDLYPEATFTGTILDFDPNQSEPQTKIIKGDFQLKNITKPIEIEATITKEKDSYSIEGELEVLIDDYNIKVPALLSPNISKKIEVSFNFKYICCL